MLQHKYKGQRAGTRCFLSSQHETDIYECFVLFVLSRLHFESVQQCWKTPQNIPQCLINMNVREECLKFKIRA